ncbi:MAG: xylulokinase [Pseudomonadota bacterium]
MQRREAGWSEQSPAEWVQAAEKVLGQLSADGVLADVHGIGLSGQMHGATVLDSSDQVLRPCMLWNDTRAHVEAEAFDGDPIWRKVSGNTVFPGFTAPKVEWLRVHEPKVFEQIARVLLPKDYLRLWLTGEAVSEMSDASGTSWVDVGKRDWSDVLLAKSGLSDAQMPRLVEGSAASGQVRSALAERFGLPKDCIVAGGGGDNAASAIGTGVVVPGTAFVSLGTSGVLFAATEAYSPDAATAVHTFCHAVPDTWHQMGVILSAADSLEWLSGLTGQGAPALTDALGPLQAPGRTCFLPYLGGERTPHNDAQVRGAFLGLEHVTDVEAATRAVLEGVCFAFADCQKALADTGTGFETVLAIGGGARASYWLCALATALNTPLSVPVAGDFGAAFGAARLGAMAATGAGPELATPPKIAQVIEPQGRGLTAAR